MLLHLSARGGRKRLHNELQEDIFCRRLLLGSRTFLQGSGRGALHHARLRRRDRRFPVLRAGLHRHHRARRNRGSHLRPVQGQPAEAGAAVLRQHRSPFAEQAGPRRRHALPHRRLLRRPFGPGGNRGRIRPAGAAARRVSRHGTAPPAALLAGRGAAPRLPRKEHLRLLPPAPESIQVSSSVSRP